MLESNRLTDLADRVRSADERMRASAQAMAENALEAGQLLIEAKAECKHGEWLPFLERAGVEERQAQRLMTLARSGLKADTVSELGIKAALTVASRRRLPRSGETLLVSADPIDASALLAAGTTAALIWQSPEAPGSFHVAGWRNDGELGLALESTRRPIDGRRPEIIFGAVDAMLRVPPADMQCQLLANSVPIAEMIRAQSGATHTV